MFNTSDVFMINSNMIEQTVLNLHIIRTIFGLDGMVVLNATFNNISVISWRSFLLVEETGVPRENNWPVASHWQTLSHNIIL